MLVTCAKSVLTSISKDETSERGDNAFPWTRRDMQLLRTDSAQMMFLIVRKR